ncbi:MAG: bifunctional phosphoribosylaminoimidazolecarboxamide formyltransferase/IMP cyclohydrolase [Cytophagales bacterium]|nr:bifunctional phosphoribosylaminoimidazolecarboxamide formyltransferase/IMP cyclohydrolase [Cytophagales bacterium]
MEGAKKIRSALLSVHDKEGIVSLAQTLYKAGVSLFATGGTYARLIQEKLPVKDLESLTGYPPLFGGRVKTLHPKIFGGILYRRGNPEDEKELKKHEISSFDLVVVNLYPFQEAAQTEGIDEEELCEYIDIGGSALLRAAAKNYMDLCVLSSPHQYAAFSQLFDEQGGRVSQTQRRSYAVSAFTLTSSYDESIVQGLSPSVSLRYGENPHQRASFYGDLSSLLELHQGSPLSYNNLLDIEAGIELLSEWREEDPTVVIIKHNNPCGIAQGGSFREAFQKAYACDSLSAFGGIIMYNGMLSREEIGVLDGLFYEGLVAPSFTPESLSYLKGKNRRIIQKHRNPTRKIKRRTILDGKLEQGIDFPTRSFEDMELVCGSPTQKISEDLYFAYKIVKHVRSNGIVLVRGGDFLSAGMGHTSRIEALEFAIQKAEKNSSDLRGSVMASDGFFPFSDCIERAHEVGITAVIQPGGSKNDKLSIQACRRYGMSMVFSHRRHFKH